MMEHKKITRESASKRKPLPRRARPDEDPTRDDRASPPNLPDHQTSTRNRYPALHGDDMRPLIERRASTGQRLEAPEPFDSVEMEPLIRSPATQGPDDTTSQAYEVAHDTCLQRASNSVKSSATAGTSRSAVPKSTTANDGPAEPRPQTPLAWKATLLAWWQELLWCFVSLCLIGALAAVLSYFNDKRLPELPLELTLNTVIALLATLARAAFVEPVSESISQLKWLWYRQQRPLKDFQDFDDASRGPWGTFQLVKTTKGWFPSVISMLVFGTAILTSTLTQSTVTYPTRLVPVAAKTALSRTVRFHTDTYIDNDQLKRFETLFDNTVYSGVSHSHESELPFAAPRCPTTECRWDDFNTLEVCAKTWDVAEHLDIVSKGSRGRYSSVCLPGGTPVVLTSHRKGKASLETRRELLAAAGEDIPRSSLFNFSVVYYLGDLDDEGLQGTVPGRVGAVEAMLYFCVRRYSVSVRENVPSRELVGTTAAMDEVETHVDRFGFLWRPEAMWFNVPGEPGTNFSYRRIAADGLRQSLSMILDGSYSHEYGPGGGRRNLAPARYVNVLEDVYKRGDLSNKERVVEAIRNVTNNVARSSSNMMPDPKTNVTGTAYVSETYVLVRWQWLVFISAQVLLSAALLAVAIIKTRNAGLGVIKNSTLPAFFAIDSHDKRMLEQGSAGSLQQKEVEEMVGNESGAGLRLGLAERGWILRR